MAEPADDLRETVRRRYAAAAVEMTRGGAGCCGDVGCSAGAVTTLELGESFGSALYSQLERDDLPVAAVAASLGCGNPTAVADLKPGERVLDLGSGGGIDVLLSATRVGPTGFAYGVDMTTEMLDLSRANATRAGAVNVEFLRGLIENIPLPDGAVDVIISNCVINLSTDKPAVLAEMFRVLTPGGRIGINDVVAEDELTAEQRSERGAYGLHRGTSTGSPQPGSSTRRWSSLTRWRIRCTPRSSAPPDPPNGLPSPRAGAAAVRRRRPVASRPRRPTAAAPGRHESQPSSCGCR